MPCAQAVALSPIRTMDSHSAWRTFPDHGSDILLARTIEKEPQWEQVNACIRDLSFNEDSECFMMRLAIPN